VSPGIGGNRARGKRTRAAWNDMFLLDTIRAALFRSHRGARYAIHAQGL